MNTENISSFAFKIPYILNNYQNNCFFFWLVHQLSKYSTDDRFIGRPQSQTSVCMNIKKCNVQISRQTVTHLCISVWWGNNCLLTVTLSVITFPILNWAEYSTSDRLSVFCLVAEPRESARCAVFLFISVCVVLFLCCSARASLVAPLSCLESRFFETSLFVSDCTIQ